MLWLVVASLIISIFMTMLGELESAGPLVVFFFTGSAILFQRFYLLKGFSYAMMIFASVSVALFYPEYFVSFGEFKTTKLITPLLQIIMFGMGTAMSIKDFYGVIKMPVGVFVGIVCQFTIMPLIGFTLAFISPFSSEIAAGIILIGSAPSGLASNVMAYLARANLALSITLTAVATMLSPLVTPFLMKMLAGQFIEIDALKMMWDIVKMVIIPIAAGLLFNRLLKGKIAWLDNAMPLVSMAGIAVIIAIIVANGRESLLNIGPLLIGIAVIHNLAGYVLGYFACKLLRMEEKDCRTISIEVGMQNGGLASGIAAAMGKAATLGLAPAVFGPFMNISGSILASWWHRKQSAEEGAAEPAS